MMGWVLNFLLIFGSISVDPSFASEPAPAAQIQQLQQRLRANPSDVGLRDRLAFLQSQRRQWSAVIELINPYTDLAKPRSLVLLVSAYQETRKFEEAVRVLKILTDKFPKDAHLHYMLGHALLKQGALVLEHEAQRKLESEGIESLRMAIRLNRGFRPPYDLLINHFLRTKMHLEARELLLEMLQQFPGQGAVNADLCRLFALDGFLAQAVKHCQLAIQQAPQLSESYVYLAQAQNDMQESALAEKTLLRASQRHPASEFVQYGAGQYYLLRKNFPVAKRYFLQAVKTQPKSARAQMGLAVATFESGDPNTALAHFTQACRLDSNHQGDFLSYASRLRQSGNVGLGGKYTQAANGCKK